jgi:hypothetical protein
MAAIETLAVGNHQHASNNSEVPQPADSSIPHIAISCKTLKTKCPPYVQMTWACGCPRRFPTYCSDPLCVVCQKVWAWQVRTRWLPVVKQMHSPRLITLTLRNGHDLAERWDFEAASFRRFLDLRLGSRRWPDILRQATDYAQEHYSKHEPDAKEAAKRLQITLNLLADFGKMLAKYTERNGQAPRVRDILGKGFSVREATYSRKSGWHVHRHITVDAGSIPWAALVVIWRIATKGDSWIVDIRYLKPGEKAMREAVKYLTKPWEIPDDKADELRRVVRGKKRIWPLGGARPVSDIGVCPGCGKKECKVVSVGMADTVWSGEVQGRQLVLIRARATGAVELLELRDGQWVESDALNLIPMDFACHEQSP